MKIKLPKYLSYSIAGDRSLKRAVSIYIYLKALDVKGRGVIKFDLKAKKEAAVWLLCNSTRTIDAWLKDAITHKLITKNDDTLYTPISWDKLCMQYNVLCTGFYYVPLGKVPLKDVLDCKCMVEQYYRCKTAAQAKLKQPGVDIELHEVMLSKGLTTSDSDIKKLQHVDYISGGRALTEAQRHAVYISNTDYSTGSRKYKIIFNTKNFFYKKTRLQLQGIIQATKRNIEVPESCMPYMRTSDKRETNLGTLQYVRETKSLVLFLCDAITFNKYNQWQALTSKITPKPL